MGIPLWVTSCFSLAAFNSYCLCLIFVSLINMYLGMFHLGVILFGTLWLSWTWVPISFRILGTFSTVIAWSIFSCPFFLSLSFGIPVIWMLVRLTLSQRSLRLSSCQFFFLFSSLLHFSTILLPHLFSLLPQLFYCWFPPECFWSQYYIIQYWLTLLYFF